MNATEQLSIESIAQSCGVPYVAALGDPSPPQDLVHGDFDRIVGSWAKQRLTVPLRMENEYVVVATAAPLDRDALRTLEFCYQRPIKVIATSTTEIQRIINAVRTTLMSNRSSALDSAGASEEADPLSQTLKIDVTDAEDEDAPIIRYVNAILFRAHAERASDVHIESYEDKLKVRFRIDGVLIDIASEELAHQAKIISRLKVMAGLNIAEKRLPQDGRIGIKIAGKDVDIRVSTVPTQFGERIVLRLLDKSSTKLELVHLGMNPGNFEKISDLIKKPNGIFLVTGPTGSGKTTTLYACLAQINTPDLNILTVEDPIEYQLDGVGQMQVNPKINFTFASGLRAILRQDPDVVMVGEIRDSETAEIAIQASLTGHLVLSTLHTNDAPGAITRLLDMGIEPFLVSSSLLAVLAQRLVRKLCAHCREPYELTDTELRELGVNPSSTKTRTAYRPGTSNCPHCQNSRYTGRIGIHELLTITDQVRTGILQKQDSSYIKNVALTQGFEPLRVDGAYKVLQGLTSVEEVLLATHEEKMESAA